LNKNNTVTFVYIFDFVSVSLNTAITVAFHFIATLKLGLLGCHQQNKMLYQTENVAENVACTH